MMDHTSYKSPGYTAVKTCCCVRDVLQGNKVIITVIIQRNLDTVRNIDRFCQFKGSQFEFVGSQFEFEHPLCIQLDLFSLFFRFNLLHCHVQLHIKVMPIAADVLAKFYPTDDNGNSDRMVMCTLTTTMQDAIQRAHAHCARRNAPMYIE